MWPVAVAADSVIKGWFEFDRWDGPMLDVHYAHRGDWSAETPVVIVMHGTSRAAERYLDDWTPLAVQHGFLVIVPHFDAERFPGSRSYNLGNTFDEQGQPRPATQWTYSVIEPLFDAVRETFDLDTAQYDLYGHSAGSQFVHRFLAHLPDNRVRKAVAANAGWYTYPDLKVPWPYGLKRSLVSETGLRRFLETPMLVLLGKQDTDGNDTTLRQTPEAMRQGPHRLARGFHFFEAGLRAAQRLGVESAWQLAQVEGADHDNAKMAPAAAFFLVSD
ncbi:MAG: alpha/beta hydrolase [Xanthomonadales bacterium]|nr:alpha/beta hydrolase [Xanthomonadales bacterium]